MPRSSLSDPTVVSSIASIPAYRLEQQHDILQEAAKQATERTKRGSFATQKARAAAEKLAQLGTAHRPTANTLPVEILPGMDPIPFTPQEILTIQNDPKFARQIYQRFTGVHGVTRTDVSAFQERVHDAYPQLEESLITTTARDIVTAPPVSSRVAAASAPVPPPPVSSSASAEAPSLEFSLQPGKVRLLIGRYNRETTGSPLILPGLSYSAHEGRQLLKQLEQKARIGDSLAQSLLQEASKDIASSTAVSVPVPPPPVSSSASAEAPSLILGPQSRPTKLLTKQERELALRRVGVIRDEEAIKQAAGTIAPFNVRHAQAERLMRASQEHTQQQGVAHERRMEQIRAMPIEGREDLEQARKLTPQEIQDYYNPYLREVIEPLREEMEEEWTRKIAPSISGHYAIAGASRGSAHAQALANAHERHKRKLFSEVARLRFAGYDAAQKAAEVQQARAMERAQIKAHLSRAAQQHALGAADAELRHAYIHKTHEAADAQAMGQLAMQHQAQQQHEIDEARKEYELESALPMHLLQEQAALSSGLPPPQSTLQLSAGAAPAPPNGPAVLGGLIGTTAGLLQRAKGGRIKQRFADGGMPSWQALSRQVEADKYMQPQEAIAQQLQDYQFNPMTNWLGHAGSQLLKSAYGGNPLAALGHATELNNRDRTLAYQNSLNAKHMAANIHGKMQDSLIRQQHFLADYEARRQMQGETMRHHRQMEGLAGLGLQAKLAHLSPAMSQSANLSPEEAMQTKYVSLKPAQQKIADEAFKELDDGTVMASKAKAGKQLYKKIHTGPLIGRVPNWLASALPGTGTLADRDLAEQLSNELAYETSQGSKGRGSNMQLQLIQSLKGAGINTPERNVASMATIAKYGEKKVAIARKKLLRMGFTEQEIHQYLNRDQEMEIQEPQVKTKSSSPYGDLSSLSDAELAKREQELLNGQ
jgi:hypothetical protein